MDKMILKTYFLLALLCVSSVFAKDVFLEIDAGSGYREDKIKFDLINVNIAVPIKTMSVEINKEKSIPIWAYAKVNFNNIILLGEGDYSSIVGGSTDVSLFMPTNSGVTDETIPAPWSAKNRGHIYDVLGSGGYQIFFYKNQDTALSVTPRGGYGTHRYRLSFKNINPAIIPLDSSGTALTGVDLTITPLAFPKMKFDWWGPFVAGDATFKFLKNYRLSATYAYHWLDMTFKQNPTFDISLTFPFPGPQISILITKILNAKLKKAWSHRVQGNFSYLINDDWAITLFGQYQVFKTKIGNFLIRDIGSDPSGPIDREEEIDSIKLFSRMYSVALRASLKF